VAFEPAQHAVDGPLQLGRCPIERLFQRRGLLSNGNRRSTVEPCFHHAPFVIATSFAAAVLVSQMDLDAGYATGEPLECTGDKRLDLSRQLNAAIDVRIGMYLKEQWTSCFEEPTQV
jgi:hypothetical protein